MKRILTYLLMSTSLAWAQQEDHKPESVSFKEGTGVSLSEETKAYIGLEIAEVVEQSVASDIRVTAQVYREAREPSQNQGEPSGFAYASAWAEPAVAEALPADTALTVTGHPEATGVVLRVDRTAAANGGRVELLLKLRDQDHPWKIGDFVQVSPLAMTSEPVTIVPRSSVLDTAFGPFAYVVNGSSFLRTAVVLGARHAKTVEIRDGLYSGDQVVVQPVETLYLIELRATKGGGHSH